MFCENLRQASTLSSGVHLLYKESAPSPEKN